MLLLTCKLTCSGYIRRRDRCSLVDDVITWSAVLIDHRVTFHWCVGTLLVTNTTFYLWCIQMTSTCLCHFKVCVIKGTLLIISSVYAVYSVLVCVCVYTEVLCILISAGDCVCVCVCVCVLNCAVSSEQSKPTQTSSCFTFSLSSPLSLKLPCRLHRCYLILWVSSCFSFFSCLLNSLFLFSCLFISLIAFVFSIPPISPYTRRLSDFLFESIWRFWLHIKTQSNPHANITRINRSC